MKRHRQRGRLLRSSWRPPSGKRSASCTPVAVACLRGRGDRHGAGARAAALRAGGGPRRGCGHGRCTGMRPLAGASRAGRAEGLLVVSVCVRLRKRDGLDKTRDAPVTMRCARWHSVDGAAPRGADPCHSAHVAGRLVATRLQRLLQDHSRAAARRTLRHPEERRVGHLVAERSDELPLLRSACWSGQEQVQWSCANRSSCRANHAPPTAWDCGDSAAAHAEHSFMSKCGIGRGGVGGQRAATEHARSRTACCSVGDEGRRRSGGAAARPAASPAMRTARPAGLPRASGRAASGPAPLLRRRSPAAAPPARSARLPRRAKYCCAPITDRRFLSSDKSISVS